MFLPPFFQRCENSAPGEAIRGSSWLFPVILIHLVGLAVIGGAIGSRRQPVTQVALDAQGWLIGSLAIMLVSGALLFTSEALKCYYHEAFWVKMTSLLL